MKTGLILLTLLGTVAVAEVQAAEASALDKILDAGRKAAAPPAMILAARALKFGEPAVRGKTMGACERKRAEFPSPRMGAK